MSTILQLAPIGTALIALFAAIVATCAIWYQGIIARRRASIETRVQTPRLHYCNGDPEYFAGSYLNAYVANGAVIAACFGDPQRDLAANTALSKAFPRRKIVMLRIDNIADGGGGIHCLTQPQPVVQPSRSRSCRR